MTWVIINQRQEEERRKMYEVSHISNLIGDGYVIIPLKKLEDIIEELQQLKKFKYESTRNIGQETPHGKPQDYQTGDS